MANLVEKRNGMPDAVPPAVQKRIDQAVDLVREVSMQTDPQEMVRRYAARTARLHRHDAWMSLSRRDLSAPYYRVTRSSRWSHFRFSRARRTQTAVALITAQNTKIEEPMMKWSVLVK